MNRSTGDSNPRGIAVDRVEFIDGSAFGIKASDYGIETESGTFDALYTNGATWSLQPAPAAFSGYENVAASATVTIDDAGEKSTAKYLNDKIFANHTYSKAFEYAASGETEITLAWDSPVTVRAIMIYNSFDFEYAFSKIDRIEFTLAEQPASWTGKRWTPCISRTSRSIRTTITAKNRSCGRAAARTLLSTRSKLQRSPSAFRRSSTR